MKGNEGEKNNKGISKVETEDEKKQESKPANERRKKEEGKNHIKGERGMKKRRIERAREYE